MPGMSKAVLPEDVGLNLLYLCMFVNSALYSQCEPQRKLPALYLIDSIMKNLEKSSYRSLFSRNIVQTFTSVFEQVWFK